MTTPEIPSAAVARSVTAQKMRFLYPLAAVCLAAVFLTPSDGQAQTAPAKLRPDQQRAAEIALQQVEPAMRPMARLNPLAGSCRPPTTGSARATSAFSSSR